MSLTYLLRVKLQIRLTRQRRENRLYIYEHSMCWYVRLNALNAPHVPQTFIIAPNFCLSNFAALMLPLNFIFSNFSFYHWDLSLDRNRASCFFQ